MELAASQVTPCWMKTVLEVLGRVEVQGPVAVRVKLRNTQLMVKMGGWPTGLVRKRAKVI